LTDPNKGRFEERLAALAQKKDPNKRVERRVQADGLIVEVIKPIRRAPLIPIRSVFLAIGLFLALKGTVYGQLGPETYLKRLEALKEGGSIEVTVAFLLDVDPATRAIGDLVGRFLK
jgi:hypothetical protein